MPVLTSANVLGASDTQSVKCVTECTLVILKEHENNNNNKNPCKNPANRKFLSKKQKLHIWPFRMPKIKIQAHFVFVCLKKKILTWSQI